MIKIQGTHYMSDFEAKKAMVDAGKLLEQKGYVIATDGSLSVRVGPNALWVTVQDARKGDMTQDMMVKTDLDGKPLFGAREKELPEELRIHLKLYRENPEIRAVVHGYPPLATALGIEGIQIEQADFTKTLRKLGIVPVVPYTGGDSDAQSVGLLSARAKGVLFQNNGCMAWGKTPLEGVDLLDSMEYYGKIRSSFPRKESTPVLKGVTELVRPDRLLHRSNDPLYFSQQTSDVVHRTNTKPITALAPVKQETSGKATEKSKADVMAQVVCKTMESFQV